MISFAIPATGVQTITLTSLLPSIVDSVTIDGTTQPGYAGTPLIQLNGNNLAGNGLIVAGGGTTIRGLIINRFGSHGMVLTVIGGNGAGGNVVEANYIGTNAAGDAALANAGSGVWILESANNRIGGIGTGNVISGNGAGGIVVVVSPLQATSSSGTTLARMQLGRRPSQM